MLVLLAQPVAHRGRLDAALLHLDHHQVVAIGQPTAGAEGPGHETALGHRHPLPPAHPAELAFHQHLQAGIGGQVGLALDRQSPVTAEPRRDIDRDRFLEGGHLRGRLRRGFGRLVRHLGHRRRVVRRAGHLLLAATAARQPDQHHACPDPSTPRCHARLPPRR